MPGPGSGAPGRQLGPKAISLARAVELLLDLVFSYGDAAFQSALFDLSRRRLRECESGEEHKKLCLIVQSRVLPQHGFEGTQMGVYYMVNLLNIHKFDANKEFRALSTAVHSLTTMHKGQDRPMRIVWCPIKNAPGSWAPFGVLRRLNTSGSYHALELAGFRYCTLPAAAVEPSLWKPCPVDFASELRGAVQTAEEQTICALGGVPRKSCVKKALVVGVGAYARHPLRKPQADAEDMSAMLSKIGFEVTCLLHCGIRDFKRHVFGFIASMAPGDVALFYFSGHACAYDQRNWLVSADEPHDERELPVCAVDVDMVLSGMEAKDVHFSLLLLDCCRTLAGLASKRAAPGLCAVAPPRGSLVALACAPNQSAREGGGRNGVFTKYLLRHLPTPRKDVERLLRAVGRDVEEETLGEQIPCTISALRAEDVFLCE